MSQTLTQAQAGQLARDLSAGLDRGMFAGEVVPFVMGLTKALEDAPSALSLALNLVDADITPEQARLLAEGTPVKVVAVTV